MLEGSEELVEAHIQRCQDSRQRIHRNAALAAFQPTYIGAVDFDDFGPELSPSVPFLPHACVDSEMGCSLHLNKPAVSGYD